MFKTTFLDDSGKLFEIAINPDDTGFTKQIGSADAVTGVLRHNDSLTSGYVRTDRVFKTGTYKAIHGVGGAQAQTTHISKLAYDSIVGATGTADLKTTLS